MDKAIGADDQTELFYGPKGTFNVGPNKKLVLETNFSRQLILPPAYNLNLCQKSLKNLFL